MRIYFEGDYEKAKEIIASCGGEVSDFETDDCVMLGDDPEYIEKVTQEFDKNGIKYKLFDKNGIKQRNPKKIRVRRKDVLDYAERIDDDELYRCGTCAHYQHLMTCGECSGGSRYRFNWRTYYELHKKDIDEYLS